MGMKTVSNTSWQLLQLNRLGRVLLGPTGLGWLGFLCVLLGDQEHERKFADVNYKNKSVWEIIAAGMRGKGYCPTWAQCSNK